jgi:hypothetical protein
MVDKEFSFKEHFDVDVPEYNSFNHWMCKTFSY